MVRSHLWLINVDIMRMKSHVFSVEGKGYTGMLKITYIESIYSAPEHTIRINLSTYRYLLRTRFQLSSMASMSHSLVYPSGPKQRRVCSQLPGYPNWGREVRELLTDQCPGVNATLSIQSLQDTCEQANHVPISFENDPVPPKNTLV